MSREVMQQALDALSDITYNEDDGKCNACGHEYGGFGEHHPGCKVDAACDALRAALAQPTPAAPAVPDGWVMAPRDPTQRMGNCGFRAGAASSFAADMIYRAMIAAAPAQPAVPLTDEQISHFWDIHVGMPTAARPLNYNDVRIFARAIEQAHGITAPGSKP